MGLARNAAIFSDCVGRNSVSPLNTDRQLQAYVIGVAIGNLSNPNGRADRLRITCDFKYPAPIAKIFRSLIQSAGLVRLTCPAAIAKLLILLAARVPLRAPEFNHG